MRKELVLISLLLCTAIPASAQVSFSVRTPSVSIGINVPIYPRLVRVPNYPVYYAPEMQSNYFFYDGAYWVYQHDTWYGSSWYDGPWYPVEPEFVPPFILRVPVRYYRSPPQYFHGWSGDAPPHWNDHWGKNWAQRRSGWDHWNHKSAPAPAPLPVYQGQYSGDRYPRQPEQQHAVRSQHYSYQPREELVRQHYQQPQQTQPTPRQETPSTQQQPHSPQPHNQQNKKDEQKSNEGKDHGKGEHEQDHG
jgi:hypothetical protein